MSALCNAVTGASKVMRGLLSEYDTFAAVPRMYSLVKWVALSLVQ